MELKVFCVKTYYKTKSVKIVHARYRRKFNFNTFPNSSQILESVKNFEARGTCEGRSPVGSSLSGLPITQEEWALAIIHFAHRIQQCLQLNGRHLEQVTQGLLLIFLVQVKSKWILKCYLLPFNKCNFHNSVLCALLFVPDQFILKIVKHPLKQNSSVFL